MIDKTPYNPDVRYVLKLAKAEAGRLEHDYIGPEHFLLGIIRKGNGFAFQTFQNLAIDIAVVKTEMERMVGTGKGNTGLFSPNAEAKRVLEASKQIANEMKHDWVGAEHLLLALVEEDNTLSNTCLQKFGLEYEKVKKEVILVIQGGYTSPTMIDKTPYTPGMQEVLKLSKAEAVRLRHDFIGPEHFLLALIRKGDGLSIQTLMNLDVDLEDVKSEMERMVEVGKGPTAGLFSPNADAKRVLETSKQIANEMKHGWVGTEHLLLALIKEENTLASKCLRQFGVDYEKAKKEVIQIIEGGHTNPTMIDKTPYTPGMREVLKLSKAESGRLGHDYIGPEHYLLAIIRKGDGLAIQTMMNLDVDLEDVKLGIEEIVGYGKGPTVGLFSPNAEAKLVLETARQFANEMKHGWVGTEHLLMALIKNKNTAASKCLHQFGLDYDKAKTEIIKVIEGSNTSSSAKCRPIYQTGETTKKGALYPSLNLQEVFALAQHAARQAGFDHLLPGHLMQGILHKGLCMAIHVLSNLGVDLQRLWRDLEQAFLPLERTRGDAGSGGELAFHPDTTKLLNMSIALTEEWDQHENGTGHLLLILVEHDEQATKPCLLAQGIASSKVRQELIRFSQTILIESEIGLLIENARKTAGALGNEQISSEHLLLAATKLKNAQNLFSKIGINHEVLEKHLKERLAMSGVPSAGPLRFDLDVGRLLAHTEQIARDYKPTLVKLEHLLTSLLLQDEKITDQFLTAPDAREALLLNLLSKNFCKPKTAHGQPPGDGKSDAPSSNG